MIFSATVSKMDHWPRTASVGRAVRYKKVEATEHLRRAISQPEAETAKRTSTADVDIMASDRRLTHRDISVVASQLGVSWRVLGRRLNFTPETLDAIAQSTSGLDEDSTQQQMAENMLRSWSMLPTATIGRLAVVLWEMGHHVTAMLLQP
jgi:hypothetical protein